jgi:hypothetical protein
VLQFDEAGLKRQATQGENSLQAVSATVFLKLSLGGLLLLPYQTSPGDPRASIAIDQETGEVLHLTSQLRS